MCFSRVGHKFFGISKRKTGRCRFFGQNGAASSVTYDGTAHDGAFFPAGKPLSSKCILAPPACTAYRFILHCFPHTFMDPLKIRVIIGSTRPNRFSEQPGSWIFGEVQKLENVTAELLDLRDWPLPMFDQPQSPSRVENGDYGNETVNAWAKKIAEADAFVMVSPEYNHGTSAVLKNALDSVYKEWNNKVVGFVSYGSVGGARAVEQLRLNAVELQMAPVRSAVHIPGDYVWGTGWGEEAEKAMQHSADVMLEQVVRWGRAMKAARV